jgi:hypothetical protein
MNRSGGINSFGSVEDLIRTSLGGSFLSDKSDEKKNEEPLPKKEEIGETQPTYTKSKEEEDIIKSSIQRLKNFNPSLYQKKSKEPLNPSPEPSREEDIFQESIPKKQETVSSKINNYYPFYRDVEEVFECKVTIEGTASNSIARLLLETESWDIVFQGKIKKDGMCSIPIKKLSLFPVGTIGKATLEIIVDDILFTPWENPFRIEESKKVEVEVFKRRSK